MKLYDVCIRGFVKGNLGDDLFIDILCRRYPNTKFVICAEKAYKRCFSEIPNLKYISLDALLIKIFFRFIKIPTWCVNKLFLKCGIKKQFAYWGCEQLMQSLCRKNVLISGSIFMELQEGPFSIGSYQERERRYYRKNPYVIGCNFGPYHNEEYREFYQECFRSARQVCFREKYSYDKFEGENIRWGADIVFTYPKERIVPFEEKDYVVISVLDLNKDLQTIGEGNDGYIEMIIKFVRTLIKRGERVILVGFCNSQGDDKINRRIFEKCGDSEQVLVYNYPTVNYRKALGILAGAKAIVSMRYHGMILGWLFGKKVLPLVYSSKMQHVIDDVNEKMVSCDLYENGFSFEKLLKAYDCIWEEDKIDVERLIESAQSHFEKLDIELR